MTFSLTRVCARRRAGLAILALALVTLPLSAAAQGTRVLRSFHILGVPGPPNAQTLWDNTVTFWRGHPDIEVCVTTQGRICAAVCEETDTGNPDRQCKGDIGPRGIRLPASGSFEVEVWDIDVDGRQLMAMGRIAVTNRCLQAATASQPAVPCQIPAKTGTLTILFEGSSDGVLGTPPTIGGSPAADETAVPPRRDAGSLSDLRDADNCRGSDEIFPSPQGTIFTRLYRNYILGWSADADQYYGLASLVASIPDRQTRDRVKARVERRIEIERGDLPIYLDVVRDFESSQNWHAAFLEVGESFAGKLIGAGLDRLVPAIGRPGLAAEVERWIYKKLASDKLADEAVDLMFRDRNVSVECVMNELAKRGFEEAAAGQ